jgi:hypothetical protein
MSGAVEVTQADIARALKHLGFDSVEDLHYWAMEDSDLSRFGALCAQFAEHRLATEAAFKAREAELVEALEALLSESGARGRYHSLRYADAVEKAEAILARTNATPDGEA